MGGRKLSTVSLTSRPAVWAQRRSGERPAYDRPARKSQPRSREYYLRTTANVAPLTTTSARLAWHRFRKAQGARPLVHLGGDDDPPGSPGTEEGDPCLTVRRRVRSAPAAPSGGLSLLPFAQRPFA